MNEITIALVVASVLFLALKPYRWIGVLGVALLIGMYPLLFVAPLLLLGVVAYFIHRHKRKSRNELPRSGPRSD